MDQHQIALFMCMGSLKGFGRPSRIPRNPGWGLPLGRFGFYSAAMWIPKNEQDILTASANRSLEETVTVDAKREIPKRNSDTAVDVSALANTAGGVLLYGVDEDEGGILPFRRRLLCLANENALIRLLEQA